MTGFEILSDLVKIGVPSLLTGATAFLIARTSRSHELEKERRRRKQDFLERLAEALDDLEIRLSDVHVAAHERLFFMQALAEMHFLATELRF